MRSGWRIWLLAVLALGGCAEQKNGSASRDPAALSENEAERKAWEYNERGLQASARGDHREAVSAFVKAIELRPNVAAFYNNIGRAFYWLNDFERAMTAFQRAEALGMETAHARASLHVNMGDIYRQRERFDEAIRYYYRALEEDPALSRVHYELGNLYLKRRDMENAEYRLNRALALEPEYDKALLARAILYHLTYRDQKAWEDVEVLERRGFAVDDTLKRDILNGLEAARKEKRFRPAH